MTRPALVALLIAAIATTCALGAWQLRRAAGKEALQERIDAAARAAPTAPASAMLDDPGAMVYGHWRFHGRWIPEQVVFLDNRPHDGRAGFYVLMPLRIEEPRAATIIVDRGWLPRDALERTRIAPFVTSSAPIDVIGVALADEPRLMELARRQDLHLKTIWQNFDFNAFAKASGVRPVALVLREDAASGDASDGLVRDWPDRGGALQSQIDRHHGYAFQWFALAAALVGLILYRMLRGVRHARVVTS